MEDWMSYDRMLYEVFHESGAYPYPFGSTCLQDLYEMSDEDLRRIPYPLLRDQGVSVDVVFAEWWGRFVTLWGVIDHQGLTPYLDKTLSMTAHTLKRILPQQQRIWVLLTAAPQPRWGASNN